MSKGKVIITFDDGISNHNSAVIRLNKLGLKGVFGIVANKIDTPGFCTVYQLEGMQEDGHMIANMSWSHGKFGTDKNKPYLKSLTTDEIIEDFVKGKDDLLTRGFSGDYYISPFGTMNLDDDSFKKITEQSKWIRLTTGGNIQGEWCLGGNKRIYEGDYNDSCIGITAAADCRFPEEIKQKIDETCKVKGLCVLCYHDVCHIIGDGQSITWERFVSDMEYIANKVKAEELECMLPNEIIGDK